MLLIDKCRQLVKKFRANDPVYNCEVYLEEGCAHVDGYLCDIKSCTIRFDWLEKKSNEDIRCQK